MRGSSLLSAVLICSSPPPPPPLLQKNVTILRVANKLRERITNPFLKQACGMNCSKSVTNSYILLGIKYKVRNYIIPTVKELTINGYTKKIHYIRNTTLKHPSLWHFNVQ